MFDASLLVVSVLGTVVTSAEFRPCALEASVNPNETALWVVSVGRLGYELVPGECRGVTLRGSCSRRSWLWLTRSDLGFGKWRCLRARSLFRRALRRLAQLADSRVLRDATSAGADDMLVLAKACDVRGSQPVLVNSVV